MELFGSTGTFTYTSATACPTLQITRANDPGASPYPTREWNSYQPAWRQSGFYPQVGSGQLDKNTFNRNCPLHARPSDTYPNLDDCIFSHSPASPCPCKINQSVFFPYKRLLIGSKLILMPETESSVTSHAETTQPPLDGPKAISNEKMRCECSRSPPRPFVTPTVESGLPITPPLGRSAWLNEFIALRLKSGNMKGTSSEPGQPFFPFWREQDHVTPQEIKESIKLVKDNSRTCSTGQLPLKSDQRFVMKALRNYKRDEELQKERCRYIDPRMFADVGDLDWYMYMLSQQSRSPVEIRVPYGPDFIRVPNALGGYCYLDPHESRNDKFAPPGQAGQETLRPTVVTAKHCPPVARSAVEGASLNNLRVMNSVANEKDNLNQVLLRSEETLHDIKDRYYRLPVQQQLGSDLRSQIQELEGSQREILEQLHCRERKLHQLMRYQHQLEDEASKCRQLAQSRG